MKSLRTITKDALDGIVPMTMNSIHDEQFNIKRKIILSIVCFAFIGMLPLYAQQASAVLHHQGTVTVYSPAHFDDAFTNAEDGDTIYISEGIVSGGFSFEKRLTVIGAGQNTTVSGEVHIQSYSCTISNMVIEGTLSGTMLYDDEVLISQCRISELSVYYVGELTIDRCFVSNFNMHQYITVLNVIDCKIGNLNGSNTAEGGTFLNCNIKLFKNIDSTSQSCLATYQNCIIGGFESNGMNTETTYINCFFNADSDLQFYLNTTITQNCWYNDGEVLNDDLNPTINIDGYLGTDNTVIGCGGGVAPYTLTPAVPRITDHTISVDSKTRKLNVSLTIGN